MVTARLSFLPPLLLFPEENTTVPSSLSVSVSLSLPLLSSLAIIRHACLKVDNECSVSLEAGDIVAIITVRASGKEKESFKACMVWCFIYRYVRKLHHKYVKKGG